MPKILFIRPNISDRKSSDAMQPLVFAILSALTPAHFEKFFFDDCIEEIDFTCKADIVAITIGTYAAQRAYAIANMFRKTGAKIILGGFHVTAMPDEALQHADSLVIGDAEPVWHELLHDFENQQLKAKYFSQHSGNELNIVFDRSIFRNKKYFPVNMVQWGRGCRHNCDFCSIKSFYGGESYIRPIEHVINEIKTLDNKPVFFVDDNLYHTRELFREFLQQLIPLKKKWACQISIDVAWDAELIRLMKESGCLMVLVGIETFNNDNLRQMNKSWNHSKAEYSEAISIFRRNKMMVYGTFIFGYDFDTAQSFAPTVEYAIKNKLFLANFNPLYPMPGTALYSRLSSENRLEFDKWWLNPDFYYGKTMFKPINMNGLELESGCFDCKKKFNSLSSILFRLTDLKANAGSFLRLVLFLMVNFTNRREVYRKQKLKLGSLT